jgi:hypothetical protein
MRLFLDIARDEFGLRHLRYNDITSYSLEACLDVEPDRIERIVERLLGAEATWRLTPMDGAPEVVNRMGKETGSVLFVTARPRAEEIEAWLGKILHLPTPAIRVVATGNFDGKSEILRDHGIRYFVEDRLETCFLMDKDGITPIVFRQPWNRSAHPFIEVGNWQEIGELVFP